MSKKQSHTVESSAHRGVQRARDIRSGIRFDFAERMLRARENHRLAEIGQCVRKRGARIAHRVGAMQHHERVGIIVMRTQVINHRLPIVRRRVRRVDKRIKLGEREQACVHVRVLQQAEQPSASVGARNQAVRRVDHADGAAGICDVNAHCHLLTIAWYLISTCLRLRDGRITIFRIPTSRAFATICDCTCICRAHRVRLMQTRVGFVWIQPYSVESKRLAIDYLPGTSVVSSTSGTSLPLSSSISSIRLPLMRPRT